MKGKHGSTLGANVTRGRVWQFMHRPAPTASAKSKRSMSDSHRIKAKVTLKVAPWEKKNLPS